MSGKRQLTLFGTVATVKSNKFVIYENPNGNYQCFIERFCLREKQNNVHKKNKDLVHEAQEEWKKVAKNIDAQSEFLKLRDGEKTFVRLNILLYFYTEC